MVFHYLVELKPGIKLNKGIYKLIHLLFFIFFFDSGFAQIQEADSVNKVVFQPFSPPVQAVIENMIYTQAKIFEVHDLEGNVQNLLNYRGKFVLIYFWKKDCEECISQLDTISALKDTLGTEIAIFAFADNSKKEIQDFFKTHKYNYHVLYNAKMFGEMMYAGSLGYPRMFFINRDGYIVKILPPEFFYNTANSYSKISGIIKDYDR